MLFIVLIDCALQKQQLHFDQGHKTIAKSTLNKLKKELVSKANFEFIQLQSLICLLLLILVFAHVPRSSKIQCGYDRNA